VALTVIFDSYITSIQGLKWYHTLSLTAFIFLLPTFPWFTLLSSNTTALCTNMAERRCILKEKTRMYEPDEFIPTVNLERFNDTAGADIWVPNPNKTRPFVITESKTVVKRTGNQVLPLYPVWGLLPLNHALTNSSWNTFVNVWPIRANERPRGHLTSQQLYMASICQRYSGEKRVQYYWVWVCTRS